MITPIILSGGSGTRLWPVSRSLHPKQFISLINDTTLFQDTILFSCKTNEAQRKSKRLILIDITSLNLQKEEGFRPLFYAVLNEKAAIFNRKCSLFYY